MPSTSNVARLAPPLTRAIWKSPSSCAPVLCDSGLPVTVCVEMTSWVSRMAWACAMVSLLLLLTRAEGDPERLSTNCSPASFPNALTPLITLAVGLLLVATVLLPPRLRLLLVLLPPPQALSALTARPAASAALR